MEVFSSLKSSRAREQNISTPTIINAEATAKAVAIATSGVNNKASRKNIPVTIAV